MLYTICSFYIVIAQQNVSRLYRLHYFSTWKLYMIEIFVLKLRELFRVIPAFV